jgi:hypothetical protein
VEVAKIRRRYENKTIWQGFNWTETRTGIHDSKD